MRYYIHHIGELSLTELKKLAGSHNWQVGEKRMNPGLTDPNAPVLSPALGDSPKIFIALEPESCPRSAEWSECVVFPQCFAALFFRVPNYFTQ